MGIPTLFLSLFLCQQPEPAAITLSELRLDVIEMKSGEEVEGRITTLIDGYVEVDLGNGAMVGFSTAEVKEIRKGTGHPANQQAASVLPSRDGWFTLHDGMGVAVGWLHSVVDTRPDHTVRLVEEWEFSQDNQCFSITQLETADAQMRPLTCYWHERVTVEQPGLLAVDPTARNYRTKEERIVEVEVGTGQLRVKRTTMTGREERTLEAPADTLFPLLAMERLRRGQLSPTNTAVQVPLFDPANEEFTQRTFEPGRARTVDIDGKATAVYEVASQTSSGRNAEWLDASAHVLRREIAGPTLVAVPSDEASARKVLTGASKFRAALTAEAGHRFGLWLPNPAWEPTEAAQNGVVTMSCSLRDASITLVLIDHLDKKAQLSTAANATKRWFALMHPGFTVDADQDTKVRERQAVKFMAHGRDGRREMQAMVHVVQWHDEFVALTCQAPAEHWQELAADFEFAVRTVELDQEALEPRLQGPLARKQTNDVPSAPVAPRHPAAAPAKATPPVVLVPKDG